MKGIQLKPSSVLTLSGQQLASFLGGTLWAKIIQNVKKPSLTVNVINFEFMVLMHPYRSLRAKFYVSYMFNRFLFLIC